MVGDGSPRLGARRPSMSVRRFIVAGAVAGLALQACAAAPAAPADPTASAASVPLQIVRPDGDGPFPAVVLLHSCIGVTRSARHLRDWAGRLTALGYLVAIPDSFSTRGHPDGLCGWGGLVPPEVRVPDAYAALRQIEAMTDVAADRIGVMGFSHGGWTTLAAVDQTMAAWARRKAGTGHGFVAGVAFYPDCASGSWVAAYQASAPLLILAGEMDDWTPAVPCQRLAARAQAQGQPVSLTVYPGARHAFDTFARTTRVPEARRGRGATVGSDPAARESSIKQVEAFLGRHLGTAADPAPRRAQ